MSFKVLITLEFEGDANDEETVKEAVYQYLTALIEDDSLDYEVEEQ